MRLGRRRGAKQLYDLFKRIDMTKKVFEYRTLSLKQLGYLIRTRQTDPQFFWTNDDRRNIGSEASLNDSGTAQSAHML